MNTSEVFERVHRIANKFDAAFRVGAPRSQVLLQQCQEELRELRDDLDKEQWREARELLEG